MHRHNGPHPHPMRWTHGTESKYLEWWFNFIMKRVVVSHIPHSTDSGTNKGTVDSIFQMNFNKTITGTRAAVVFCFHDSTPSQLGTAGNLQFYYQLIWQQRIAILQTLFLPAGKVLYCIQAHIIEVFISGKLHLLIWGRVRRSRISTDPDTRDTISAAGLLVWLLSEYLFPLLGGFDVDLGPLLECLS